MEPCYEKTCPWDRQPGPTQTGCTTKEDGQRLEISDLGSRGTVLFCSENKSADQLRGYQAVGLRLCFRICKKNRFSHDAAEF